MKKHIKKIATTVTIAMGLATISTVGIPSDAQGATASTYTKQYNSYNKQATSLINQTKKVKTRSTARSLLKKMETLENRLDRVEDRVEASRNRSLDRKIENLGDKLDNARERLEDRWNLDD